MKSCDQKLCQAEFADNHAVNLSIVFSPFTMVYSVAPRGPLDSIPFLDKTRIHGKAATFVSGLQEVHHVVHDNYSKLHPNISRLLTRRGDMLSLMWGIMCGLFLLKIGYLLVNIISC